MADLAKSEWKKVFELPFQGAWATAVTFCGPNRVVAGDREGRLLVWDLTQPPVPGGEKGEGDRLLPVKMLRGHENGITRLVTLKDARRVVSASLDHTVRVWDLEASAAESGEVVIDIRDREKNQGKEAKPQPDDPGVKVDVLDAVRVLEKHQDWVQALGLSGDGRRLISGDDKTQIVVWDTETWDVVKQWPGYEDGWILSAALSPDGKLAFVGEHRDRRGDFDRPPPQARLFDVDEATVKLDVLAIATPQAKVRDNSYGYSRIWQSFTKGGLICAEFSPDGKLLALGQGGETDKGQVHLVDTETGKVLRTISGHRYGVTDVAFSSDGKYLLSSGRDTTVRICAVEDGKEIAALGKPRGGQFTDWYYSVVLSPDDEMIAATDIAGSVAIWKRRDK